MTCIFCGKKSDYMLQNGDSVCKYCLSDFPTNPTNLKLMIVSLREKLKPFEQAALKMKDFNHDKPPIVHEKHWLNLIR